MHVITFTSFYLEVDSAPLLPPQTKFVTGKSEAQFFVLKCSKLLTAAFLNPLLMFRPLQQYFYVTVLLYRNLIGNAKMPLAFEFLHPSRYSPVHAYAYAFSLSLILIQTSYCGFQIFWVFFKYFGIKELFKLLKPPYKKKEFLFHLEQNQRILMYAVLFIFVFMN